MPNKSIDTKTITAPKPRRILAAIGGILAVFGLIGCLTWKTTFDAMLTNHLTLRPGTKLFDFWKRPPMEISLDMYLYNWTNPEDFRNFSTKPKFEQVGPYRFLELPDKLDIMWHPHNASISYRRKSMFKFDPTHSIGSLQDKFVTMNPVALAAACKSKRFDHFRRNMINMALNVYNNKLSVMKSVDELLFNGYTDLLLDVVSTVPTLITNIDVPYDKFGYFYTRNGTAALTDVYNVHTGADDISKLGRVNTWNYGTNTGKFDSHCGYINASAGEFQSPNLEVNGTINIFLAEICRKLPLDYVDTVEVEGVRGFKYIAGLRAIDNGTLYPENSCYCGKECLPSGLINISTCWFDEPLYLSYPHFYNADPHYLNAVEGLSPSKEKHETFIVLEPRTGFVLEVGARFQVNLLVEPMKHLNIFKNVPHTVFPVFWFEEKIRITPELAADMVYLPYYVVTGQIIGALIFSIGLVLLLWYRMERSVYLAQSNNLNVNACRSVENIEENEIKSEDKKEVNIDGPKTKTIIQSMSLDSGYTDVDNNT